MNIYCVDHFIGKNILISQLLTPLSLASNTNNRVLLPEKFSSIMEKYPNIPFSSYTSNSQKLSFFKRNSKDIDTIYTRAALEFYLIFQLKRILFQNWAITFDFRGLSFEESRVKNGESYKIKVLKYLEKFAYRKANVVRAVSSNLAQYLKIHFGKGSNPKVIEVVPCCLIESSRRVLNDNKKEGDHRNLIRFVYLGSLTAWQNITQTLELYRNIAQRLPNTSLTLITNDTEKAHELIARFEVKAAVISTTPDKVPETLRNFDIGFILRDDILVNNVASPVKFLEYIGNGIIPIISEGVGDYTPLVKNSTPQIGVLASENLDTMIQSLQSLQGKQEVYDQLYAIAQQYEWKNYLKHYA